MEAWRENYRMETLALVADMSKCTWLSKTGSCPVEINTGASRCGPGRDSDMGSF